MFPLQQIRSRILDQIRPTQLEVDESIQIYSKIKKRIKHVAKEQELDLAFIELEGSSGRKQTQLRNWRELDIFIGLPPVILPKPIELEKPKKSFIKKLFKKLVKDVAIVAAQQAGAQTVNIAYAEHPYVSLTLDKYLVDLVFCFDLAPEYILENGPITAVDRTPHHSRFVDANLSQQQRDDVRILKAFCHSVFVYGDSSPVGRSGFTGFSTEMIIYHLENIDSAFEYLSQYPAICLDFFGKSPQQLEKDFPKDFLIITDPTDAKRNIASSISQRAYQYAQHNSQRLLQHPSTSFFQMQPIPLLSAKELAQMAPNYYVIEFYDDTNWHYTKTRDKLYRYFTKLQKFLRFEPTSEPRFGTVTFEVVFQGHIFAIALYVEKNEINDSYVRVGPSVNFIEGVEGFTEKHPDAILVNDKYHVTITRTVTDAEQALRQFLVENTLSPKLSLIAISHDGITKIGKQALWILRNAIQPFVNQNIG
jgi:tRNA CCA-adding enzyme